MCFALVCSYPPPSHHSKKSERWNTRALLDHNSMHLDNWLHGRKKEITIRCGNWLDWCEIWQVKLNKINNKQNSSYFYYYISHSKSQYHPFHKGITIYSLNRVIFLLFIFQIREFTKQEHASKLSTVPFLFRIKGIMIIF